MITVDLFTQLVIKSFTLHGVRIPHMHVGSSPFSSGREIMVFDLKQGRDVHEGGSPTLCVSRNNRSIHSKTEDGPSVDIALT